MDAKLKEYLKNIDGISHITFDPKGPGVVRIYLIPPRIIKPGLSWVVLVNGVDLLPISFGWAILLREFIKEANNSAPFISDEALDEIIKKTIENTKKVFPKASEDILKKDLKSIINVITSLARGEEINEKIEYVHLSDYAKHMKAPHRMDLMISSMEKEGAWHCNQKCLFCYAKGEPLGKTKELETSDWKKIIDICRASYIPQLTFTGGEPTLRSDLVELVDYAKWFVTRLNTNGILLTKELCKELYDASLDSVQITFYSSNKQIFNKLVGVDSFDKVIEGVKNAVDTGLNVSLNTPLTSLNKDYLATVIYAHETLGIKYFTCSALIMTGAAAGATENLTPDELFTILKNVSLYLKEHDCELSFTSPGWLSEESLNSLGLKAPLCGACSSNMAINPEGEVIPCQSSLKGASLGNILKEDFDKIWNKKLTKKLRKRNSHLQNICPLKEGLDI